MKEKNFFREATIRYNEYKKGKKFKCLACLDLGYYLTPNVEIKKCNRPNKK